MDWKVKAEVEIDLNNINEEKMINYLEADGCKVIALDEFLEYVRITDLYSELDQCFEKNTLSKIQRQTIIENLINDINAGKNRRLLKM